MFQGFVHPLLAAGVLLASVPLIIHLLNRRRHKPVRWAAMRFVLAAYRKTRRRVQMENLLLLLLRMAAVALLALAVARPFTSAESPLAALTESRRDVLLVLDGSASTGYQEAGGSETTFERILERTRDILKELDAGRGDRAHLILGSQQARLLSWTTPEKALAVVATLERPTDEALDLRAALGEVLELVEKDAAGTGESALEVRLLTDMQRSVFEAPIATMATGATASGGAPPGEEGAEEAAQETAGGLFVRPQLDRLAEFGTRLAVEDLGPSEAVPPNLGVVDIAPIGPVIGTGDPVDLGVTLANFGPAARAAVRVSLYVDGDAGRQPSQRIDVPARGRAQVVFPLQFGSPGTHTLDVRLEGDALEIDNERPAVLEVPDPVRVLVVNGARMSDIEDDETGFVMAVLEPPGDDELPGGSAPFDAREIGPEFLLDPDVDLASYPVVLMANVTGAFFGEAAVSALEEHVAAGATLILTLGDRVSGDGRLGFDYTEKLFRPDGTGLLPAELTRHVAVRSRTDAYYRVKEFDATHPVLEFFGDERWRMLLTEVPFYEFVASRPLEGSRVIARFDDEGASPLLVERPYDEGRVLLWTTTIDRQWTRFPESPRTLVPFVHELMRYAGRRRTQDRNLEPGEALSLEVAAFPRSPELVRPDQTRRPIEGEAVEVGRGRWRLPLLRSDDTRRTGLYRVEIEGSEDQAFAVQAPPLEGDLERLGAGELEGLHAALRYVDPKARGASGAADEVPDRGELWRRLALLALLALVGESLWGAWIGFRRRAV